MPPEPANPLHLPVPCNPTAAMQLLQTLVGREKHRTWCGDAVPRDRLGAFVRKMAGRYPIGRNARSRAYDRKRGLAVVHLVMFPLDETQVAWWLLSDGGKGGLADPDSPDAHVAQDAMAASGHVTLGDYVLLCATKREPRTLPDRKSGKPKIVWKQTSSWTWQLRSEVLAGLRAQIDACCERLQYGAEANPAKHGWGLRRLLADLRGRPLFAGVRNQVIALHHYAEDHWAPQRKLWLAKHPDLAARYGQAGGRLRPVAEVVAQSLPLMRRMKVYDDPPTRIADLLPPEPRT